MKPFVTTLLLLAVACHSTAYAQRTARKKATPPAQRAAAKPLVRPFDTALETLPAGFGGHDPEVIYKSLAQRAASAAKGEFETTAQYQSRVQAEAARPLFGDIKPDSVLAFVAGKVESLYDADRQALKVTVKFRKAWEGYGAQTPRTSLRVKNAASGDRDYTGSNAFGAKVRVTEYTSTDYDIAFTNHEQFPVTRILSETERRLVEQEKEHRDRLLKMGIPTEDSSDVYGERAFAAELQMDAASAMRAKNSLRMLAVVRLQEPYTINGTYYSKPTFDRPTEYFSKYFYLNTELLELWFYDAATGKVYVRHRAQQ